MPRRLFASMLQLVNNGNVALLLPGLESEHDAPPKLQLLKLERHHEQMFSFKAPSLHDKVRACATVSASRQISCTQEPPKAPMLRHAELWAGACYIRVA